MNNLFRLSYLLQLRFSRGITLTITQLIRLLLSSLIFGIFMLKKCAKTFIPAGVVDIVDGMVVMVTVGEGWTQLLTYKALQKSVPANACIVASFGHSVLAAEKEFIAW